MARTKQIREMPDALEALASFRSAETTIRAEYAARAEREIAKRRDQVLDILFVKYADSGPSEVANSTGLSRSTVIRWRKDFLDREGSAQSFDEVAADASIAAGDYTEEEVYGVGGKANQADIITFATVRDTDADTDVHQVTNNAADESVFIVWADVYGQGDTPQDSVMIPKPDWLTDEIIEQAEAKLGFPVPGKKR